MAIVDVGETTGKVLVAGGGAKADHNDFVLGFFDGDGLGGDPFDFEAIAVDDADGAFLQASFAWLDDNRGIGGAHRFIANDLTVKRDALFDHFDAFGDADEIDDGIGGERGEEGGIDLIGWVESDIGFL